MKSAWQIVDSGPLDPSAVMAKDSYLLAELKSDDQPLLHFYEWNVPCLTYGYFTDPSHHLDLNAIAASGLHLARRPTGGGIVFHLTDFAFSILIPVGHSSLSQNTLENYALINQRIADAIAESTPLSMPPELISIPECSGSTSNSFCMAKPTPYDLTIEGKKVGGAAQRRTKTGLLHQGTLSLCPPPFALLGRLLKDPQIVASMRENSFYLLPSESGLHAGRCKVKELLLKLSSLSS